MFAPLVNPYGELFKELSKPGPDAGPGVSDELKLRLRKKLIWAYSWAVPSAEAVAFIASHSPLVEMGAGTGYWAWLISQLGADVVAYDLEPAQKPSWFDVRQGGPEKVSAHPDRALFLCWPPFESSMAVEALQSFRGSTVLYLGEWEGRTADPAFHDLLKSDWKLEETFKIPCWPGYTDAIHRLSRRS